MTGDGSPDTADGFGEVTADIFLGGKVTVFQPARGFRAGTDSVLLAAALDGRQSGICLDVGCGAGGALLPALWRLKAARFCGLECDPAMAALAHRGISHNGFDDRAEIVTGTVAAMPTDWANRFDLVFSNPPFFEPGAIAAPGRGKETAYLESVPLHDWIAAMLDVTRPKGRLVMIHRAAALVNILAGLQGRAGEIAVLPVRSYPGADAKRVIVRARKGLRAGPARLLAGIDLHDRAGGPRTEVALAVSSRGEGLDWSGRVFPPPS